MSMDALRVDTRIDARWCVPMDRDGAVEDHALVVDRGRIVALVPAAEADARFAPRERIELATHVLMPGLVNAHTHAAMTLLRGIADDVPLDAWLRQHIWPAETAHLAPDFVFDGTLVAAAEMLAGGTTTAADMYFFPEAAARAYLAAGMRAVLGMPVLDLPMAGASDADAHLARGLAARDALKGEPLKQMVAAVSVGIYQGEPVLDLDYLEDSAAETDLNVVMTDAGGFIEVQGTAEGAPFQPEELNAMLALAKKGVTELFELQRAALVD